MSLQPGKVYRDYTTPQGVERLLVRTCDCGHSRGPAGGVCRCGGAILSDGERVIIDDVSDVTTLEAYRYTKGEGIIK